MTLDTKKLRVFKLTDAQMEMLVESVMFAYEMDIEERNNWDRDEFEKMTDEVISPYNDALRNV
tara:strand:+ start:40 stop:228 length:189 start_codon:yes stop_codon:yes gene_type:complete